MGHGRISEMREVAVNLFPIPNSQFPIPNSQCPIPNPQLTE
ncbi:MAG: hypothetical protein V7K98_01560 [Nostoc sp.]